MQLARCCCQQDSSILTSNKTSRQAEWLSGLASVELNRVGCVLQKYLPLDLRQKKTRAIRRRLTRHQVPFSIMNLSCMSITTSPG